MHIQIYIIILVAKLQLKHAAVDHEFILWFNLTSRLHEIKTTSWGSFNHAENKHDNWITVRAVHHLMKHV